MQTNPDHTNNKYNIKYIFVIVSLIKGCFPKKSKSRNIPIQKVIKAKANSCLIK